MGGKLYRGDNWAEERERFARIRASLFRSNSSEFERKKNDFWIFSERRAAFSSFLFSMSSSVNDFVPFFPWWATFSSIWSKKERYPPLFQSTIGCKRSITDITHVRSLSCVCSVVDMKIRFGIKSSSTDITNIRVLSGVRSPVHFEVRFVIERTVQISHT